MENTKTRLTFEPVSLQLAFFLTTIDLSSKLKLASIIKDVSLGHINTDPILLPINPGIPPSFPQLILKDDLTGWIVQLSQDRLDIAIDPSPPPYWRNYDLVFQDLQSIGQKIYIRLASRANASCNRMGLVFTSTSQNENAPQFLSRKYLKHEMSKNCHEVRLESLHKIDINRFKLNQWSKLRAVAAQPPEPSILISEIDINTQSEVPIDFTKRTIVKFIDIANDLISEVMEKLSQYE